MIRDLKTVRQEFSRRLRQVVSDGRCSITKTTTDKVGHDVWLEQQCTGELSEQCKHIN